MAFKNSEIIEIICLELSSWDSYRQLPTVGTFQLNSIVDRPLSPMSGHLRLDSLG